MNRNLAKLLQALVVLIGLVMAGLMLWEPHLEGRNAHATVFQIYFQDPFLAYVYAGSIPFFLALHQAFKVLGLAADQRLRSPETARALRNIRHCALALVGLVAIAEVFIILGESDDRAGGVAMGLFAMLGSAAIAFAATAFERYVGKPV